MLPVGTARFLPSWGSLSLLAIVGWRGDRQLGHRPATIGRGWGRSATTISVRLQCR